VSAAAYTTDADSAEVGCGVPAVFHDAWNPSHSLIQIRVATFLHLFLANVFRRFFFCFDFRYGQDHFVIFA
jgi:hypothetical protein